MNSHRRKQGKPIESVELKVSFKADKRTLSRIKKAVPEATWKHGELSVTVQGEDPARVADKTKELSDRVRAALDEGGHLKFQKDFKK